MAPLAPRLRPLSLLLRPRAAAAAHLRPLLPPLLSAFSSSSVDNKCGPGSETPLPQAPGDEQRRPLGQTRSAQQARRRKEEKKIERAHSILAQPDWDRSAVIAALTPRQAASVATSHPDAVRALDLLLFLAREHSHKYLPDTFATLALRLVEASKYPAAVGTARRQMIMSCSTKAEMMLCMDVLDTTTRRGPRMGLLGYRTLLIQLSSLGMTATLMDTYHGLLGAGLELDVPMYNTVINALCKDGNVKGAQSVMDDVSKSGMKPDGFTYRSMILGYCNNNDLDSAFAVFARMGEEGFEPSSTTYSALINGLCKSGRVNEALGLIGDMTRHDVLPTACTYTPPIAALCDMGRTEDAWRLFVDMKKKGCRPNVHTYTSLISGQHVPRVAIGLFHRMARDGVLPNGVTYNALINVLVEDRKMDSALTVCKAMQRHGYLPDTITYNEMIKGYCTIGDTDKAMSMLLNNLLKEKPTATLVSYNTIIKGYCDSGNTSAALRILELMKANGCEPDVWSYTELICGFCKISEMESASRLFNEMVDHGLRPNEVTYTTLISGYCKDEKLDCAAQMLEQMKESGCRPGVQAYNILIHALTKQNNFSAAEKLCEVMIEEDVSPNAVTYSTMIDGLCKNGATSLALEMLNRMVQHSCLPNLYTYSSLIQALGQEGKVEEAEELFSDLLRQGHTPDEVAYAKMIEVYIISGRVDCAFDLLGKMINIGCQPTSRTYSVLIKGLQNEYLMVDQKLLASRDMVSNCSFDDQSINKYAISVLSSKLAELDIGLSRQLYDALLSGLSKNGRWFEADKLYRSMVGKGLCPNQEAYNYLIISLLRALKVDLALGVFRHMSAQCRELNLVGYKALICALCQSHRRKEAQFIFEHMLSRTFNPDNIVWTVLIDGLLGAGYKDLCMEFLHIMEKKHCKPSFRSYTILAREVLKE